MTEQTNSNIRPIIKPHVVTNKTNEKIEFYKSNIGNLFSSNDATLSGQITTLTEQGFYGDVIKALTIYDNDELVASLVDKMRYTSNQPFYFNLNEENSKEEIVWKEWSNTINQSTNNSPMGLKNFISSMIQSIISTGMVVVEVEWGKQKIGRKTYNLPIKIGIIPTLSVKLVAGRNLGEEEIWVSINEEYEKSVKSDAQADYNYEVRYFGDPESGSHGKREPRLLKENATAIKFNWNPNNTTLYPTPLIKRAFSSVALRHKFLEADMSLLEGIIDRILHVKVGDKDIDLMPETDEHDGDINEAANMFYKDKVSQIIVTPYYYDMQYIQPNQELLMQHNKYIPTTQNILSAFGIITNPDTSSTGSKADEINLKIFKEYVSEVQSYVESFFNKLCRKIVKNNKSLKGIPDFRFDKPDFEDNQFKQLLIELYNLGSLDIYTLLEKYGLSPETVIERLKIQKDIEEKEDIFQVRSTFKQESNNSDGTTTKSDKFDKGGRPTEGKETINKE